jgi:hypothetical protein
MNDCEGCRAQKIQNPLHQTFNAQKKKGQRSHQVRVICMFVCEHPFITQYSCRVISGKHGLGWQETANHHRK